MSTGHTSVLTNEVMAGLSVAENDVVVDATVGGAGHFSMLYGALGAGGTLVGIDADVRAIDRAREASAHDSREARPAVHLVVDNFKNMESILRELHIRVISKALFDLGWSGFQLNDARGFSFQGEEPLIMTYGVGTGRTAAELVNGLPERELADLIYTFGEERFARGIARSIVRARAQKRITSTKELVDAIVAGVPARYRTARIHPATKTFQALRMAVNDELGAITEGVTAALAALAPGGRIAVISFHSIEDRRVKKLFAEARQAGRGKAGKAILPSREEIAKNPRSRSAKLRIFERHA